MPRMNSSTRVHFRAPERLIKQADALAVAEEKTRTDVLVDALREYLAESSDEERVQQAIADAYYEDCVFDQVRSLVGIETAQNFRVLKRQLTNDRISDELAGAFNE
jgi:metal-responsive CopG/Arc/MetJ family transcriptional regulator